MHTDSAPAQRLRLDKTRGWLVGSSAIRGLVREWEAINGATGSLVLGHGRRRRAVKSGLVNKIIQVLF